MIERVGKLIHGRGQRDGLEIDEASGPPVDDVRLIHAQGLGVKEQLPLEVLQQRVEHKVASLVIAEPDAVHVGPPDIPAAATDLIPLPRLVGDTKKQFLQMAQTVAAFGPALGLHDFAVLDPKLLRLILGIWNRHAILVKRLEADFDNAFLVVVEVVVRHRDHEEARFAPTDCGAMTSVSPWSSVVLTT